jgi:hypothetical protein
VSAAAEPLPLDPGDPVSLCDVLDRVLTTGVVVTGEVVISVADVELIYVGLQLVLSSVETMRAARPPVG